MEDYLFVTLEHQYRNFLVHHERAVRERRLTSSAHVLDADKGASPVERRSVPYMIGGFRALREHLGRSRPAIIVSSHPTAGLMVALLSALRISRARWVHWFTGQVWATRASRVWRLHKAVDFLICRYADVVLCDSPSQLAFLRANGFARCDHLKVLGRGSIAGVASNLLTLPPPDPHRLARTIRVGYVGRIAREKGVLDLIRWAEESRLRARLELGFFGEPDDAGVVDELEAWLKTTEVRATYHRYVADNARVFGSFDVLLAPSYREGFGSVVIEAQAAGIPVVARNIYGFASALLPGVTGFVFDDVSEIDGLLEKLIASPARFAETSTRAREFVTENFARPTVLARAVDEYERIRTA